MTLSYHHENMKKIRESFIEGHSLNPKKIRPVILESWIRSQGKGINANLSYLSNSPVMNITNIPEIWIFRREANINVLQKLYKVLNENDSVVFFSDENLNIWLQHGNSNLLNILNSQKLGINTNMSECTLGTNALALAARTRSLQCVMAAEHYHHLLINLVSIASPMYDGDNIVGYILILIPFQKYSSFVPLMLEYFLKTTQLEISNLWANSKLLISEEYLKMGFNQSNKGYIFIDKNQFVLKTNQWVLDTFHLGQQDIYGQYLKERFFELDEINDCLLSGKQINLREIQLKKPNEVKIFVECQPVKYQGQIIGGIITLYDTKQIHKIANQISGSNAYFSFDNIIGENENFVDLKDMARDAAKGDSNILIIGESGTGKELFAQAIHNESNRKKYPFISINCAAIPKELIGSELFGYVEGAFTGARKGGAPGKFELADKGTIFLDEIGEMPIDMQSVLLRVLEEKRVTRLGGGKNTALIDVRIIAATNRNLWNAVQSKEFRLDLYYRLNVIDFELIPLRDRKDDIPLLINQFLQQFNITLSKNISGYNDEALAILQNYNWPGNIRQLRNIVERGVNLTKSTILTVNEIPKEIFFSQDLRLLDTKGLRQREKKIITEFSYKINERSNIEDLMKKYKGNKSRVAEELGISRVTLYKKLQHLFS